MKIRVLSALLCGVYWDLLCMEGSPVVSNASSPRTPTNGVPALRVWVVVRSPMWGAL